MAASTLQFMAHESVNHDTEMCKDVQRDEPPPYSKMHVVFVSSFFARNINEGILTINLVGWLKMLKTKRKKPILGVFEKFTPQRKGYHALNKLSYIIGWTPMIEEGEPSRYLSGLVPEVTVMKNMGLIKHWKKYLWIMQIRQLLMCCILWYDIICHMWAWDRKSALLTVLYNIHIIYSIDLCLQMSFERYNETMVPNASFFPGFWARFKGFLRVDLSVWHSQSTPGLVGILRQLVYFFCFERFAKMNKPYKVGPGCSYKWSYGAPINGTKSLSARIILQRIHVFFTCFFNWLGRILSCFLVQIWDFFGD